MFSIRHTASQGEKYWILSNTSTVQLHKDACKDKDTLNKLFQNLEAEGFVVTKEYLKTFDTWHYTVKWE